MNAITLSKLDDARIEIVPNAIKERDRLYDRADALAQVPIDSQETRDVAVEAVAEIKGMKKAVEANRAELKAPILDLGRQLDGAAKGFLDGADLRIRNLETKIGAYEAEERRKKAEAERKAQEEKRRLQEEERRLQAEIEAKRREQEKRVEAERLAAEDELFRMLGPDTPAEASTPPEASQEPAKPAALPLGPSSEDLEAQRKDLEAKLAESKARRIEQTAALAQTRKPASDGVAFSQPWRYEVLDLDDLYKARPDLCEIRDRPAAIAGAIRAGAREIPGLRIFQETRAVVRT